MIGNNQPVLDSGAEADLPDALRISAASEIVELVVLTSDEVFLQTLREAIGDARRLWHVSAADKVSDLLVVGEVGILVLDVQALNESSTLFVAQIKRQFPDLVIVVAGHRDAEASLAGLISAGIVYRFIHKPASPGRAKLFADAAVKKYEEHRKRSASIPPSRRHLRSNRGVLISGTGVLGAMVVSAWVMHRSAEVDTDAPRITGRAPSSAEAPLPPDAAAALAEAREHLTAQLAKSHARVKTAQAPVPAAAQTAAHARGDPKVAEGTSTPLADVVPRGLNDAQRMDVHLIDPDLARAPGAVAPAAAAAANYVDTAQGSPAPSPESTPAPDADPAGGGQHLLGNVVAAGALTLVKSVQPVYPAKANLSEIQGWVELDFTVAESGAVKDIVVHAARPAGVFEEAAIRALSQWRFKPVVRDTKSVPQRARIRIRFALAD